MESIAKLLIDNIVLAFLMTMPVTGANLPEELFSHIIQHIQISHYYHEADLAGVLPCTLVCLYWANHVRRIIWPRVFMRIRSRVRAEEFRRFCLSPPITRLEPIAELIDNISVIHNFKTDGHLQLHYLFLSKTRIRPQEIQIKGPVPPSVPLASLRTPYWGVPRSLPRTIAQCREFTLRNLSFASLDDVISLASHFTCSKLMSFDGVTWPSSANLHPRTPILLFSATANAYPTVYAQNCTDPATLFLHLAGIGLASGPLHALTAIDQVVFSELFRGTSAVSANGRSWFSMQREYGSLCLFGVAVPTTSIHSVKLVF